MLFQQEQNTRNMMKLMNFDNFYDSTIFWFFSQLKNDSLSAESNE